MLKLARFRTKCAFLHAYTRQLVLHRLWLRRQGHTWWKGCTATAARERKEHQPRFQLLFETTVPNNPQAHLNW